MAVFLAATVIGLFFTAQIYFSAASVGHGVSWGQALYWALGDWYEWALLAPLIFWVCRRFRFERKNWGRTLAVHFASGLVLAAVHAFLCAVAAVAQGWVTQKSVVLGPEFVKVVAARGHYNFAVYWMIVCGWHAWMYYHELRQRERDAAELAAKLAHAQLQSLRMQLNPHFLFNTLNAVSSLMLRDVKAANAMIARLAELLRLALETTNQQEVSLGQEVDFLRKYLDIQKIRFGDRLDLKIAVDPATLGAAVPNMILQPIVENAIEHAVEPREDTGRIELESVREESWLVLSVSDNGSGMEERPDEERLERIGLGNSRERLRKLYGEEQRIDLVRNAMGGITARIFLPLRLLNA